MYIAAITYMYKFIETQKLLSVDKGLMFQTKTKNPNPSIHCDAESFSAVLILALALQPAFSQTPVRELILIGI